MATDRILFGIGGLVIGIVIGFMFANSINRTASEAQMTSTSSSSDTPANMNLPPDHPPVGTSGGQTQGAIPQVAEAIERAKNQPESYEAQMTAGDLYYQIQRFADAAKFYEKASQIKPGEVEPMVKLGNAYFDAEQYEAAEKWYLKVLEKTPKDTNVRTDLGLTYYLRSPRNIEKAVKEFQAALAIEPDKEITLQNLALAYREGGDEKNFQAILEKLKNINPNNPAVTRSAEEK